MLLTTRTQSTGGLAQRIDLERMELDEGTLFLLRRSKTIMYNISFEDVCADQRALAQEIVQLMDGLPLALDQAGAYIEETACSLSDYFDRYQKRRTMLLNIRGCTNTNHPQSVVATFSLSFEKVEQESRAAADLLRLCAFLHHNAIPEEIITEGASELGPVLQAVASDPFEFDVALALLRKYSLLRRNSEIKMLSIHRLVQTVLKDKMDEEMQHQWAEHTVRAVNATFPDVKQEASMTAWHQWQRCIPHAHICTSLIDTWDMTFPEAGRLIGQIGAYILDGGQYDQAEILMKKSLEMLLSAWGPEHPDVAAGFCMLGNYYMMRRGLYTQAEPLLHQGLAIHQKILGSGHPDVIDTLNDLSILYHIQGKFVQAELGYQQAQDTCKPIPEMLFFSSMTLNNFACLYLYQGKYASAEPMFTQALTQFEKAVGLEHHSTAFTLNNLARLYRDWGQYIRSESWFERALALRERFLGPENYVVAQTLNDWSQLCYYQGKYVLGERFCHRALAIWKPIIGMEHPVIAQVLNNLAMLAHIQGECAQAEIFAQQALTIREQAFGPDHPKVAQTLNVLANIHCSQEKYAQAEAYCIRAIKIYKQALGPENHRVAQVLANLTLIHLAQGRYLEAEEHCLKALTFRKNILGEKHPDVAQSLVHLARTLYHTGRYVQAEAYYQDALAIQEETLGGEHIAIVTTLDNLAALLSITGRDYEAIKVSERAKEIQLKHAHREKQAGS